MFKLNTNANERFCSSDCPCYIDPANNGSDLAIWLNDNGFKFNNVEEKKKNYQGCVSPDIAESANVVLFGALEELLGCSGWCEND